MSKYYQPVDDEGELLDWSFILFDSIEVLHAFWPGVAYIEVALDDIENPTIYTFKEEDND